MAVELEKLYVQLIPEYNIRLCTQSCFEKRISWIHMVEDIELHNFCMEMNYCLIRDLIMNPMNG